MPIIRSGYAKHQRLGSTRAYRRARALALSTQLRCALCGEGEIVGDPWEAHHVAAFADHGHAGPLAKAHRSCNRRLGRA